MSESDAERLTLRGVSRAAAGRYMCEVSADAPSFHTAQVNTTLAVVDMPTSGPVLRGIKPRYRAGARLHADCVCRDSYPPVNLSYYINDTPAPPKHVKHHVVAGQHAMFTASASINFIVHPRHFPNGKIKIRCTASIYMLYWRSTEKSSVEDQPRVTSESPPPAPDPQRVALVFPVHGQAAAPSRTESSNATHARLQLLCLLACTTLSTLPSMLSR